MVIQLVLPQSRTPAVEKKKEILHGYRTSAPVVPQSKKIAPAVPQSRTRLMDYRTRYIHVYRMQIFVDSGTAGAEH